MTRRYRARAERREDQQRCNSCLQWFPANHYYFRPDAHAPNGLRCQCRDCEAAADRARRRRKRTPDYLKRIG